MVTRVKLELDLETFGRLVESAAAEQRPADWQAEVILRRALGTWKEGRVGHETFKPQRATAKREADCVPA